MTHVIPLDEDLSPSISALAHALSSEIKNNMPNNNFENIANTLLSGLIDFPNIKSKLSQLVSDGNVCIWGEDRDELQILYHATSVPDFGKPHDHGRSWALYFQVSGITQMDIFKNEKGIKPANTATKIVLEKTIHMEPRTGIYFPPGSVHSASHPNAPASWIRITGEDLTRLSRQSYDANTGFRL